MSRESVCVCGGWICVCGRWCLPMSLFGQKQSYDSCAVCVCCMCAPPHECLCASCVTEVAHGGRVWKRGSFFSLQAARHTLRERCQPRSFRFDCFLFSSTDSARCVPCETSCSEFESACAPCDTPAEPSRRVALEMNCMGMHRDGAMACRLSYESGAGGHAAASAQPHRVGPTNGNPR